MENSVDNMNAVINVLKVNVSNFSAAIHMHRLT